MKKFKVAICFLVLTLLLFPVVNYGAAPVKGDGGMLPLFETWLHQSSQNAIVAWNGNEEILILSTNVKSGTNGTAVQILPLPSYPEIKEGNESSFHKVAEIVGNVYYKTKEGAFAPGTLTGGGGIEILFTTQIGVHNLTVVKVNDSADFTNFLRETLEERNQTLINKFDALFPNFENIAEKYVQQNIKYFVVDDIETKEDTKTVQPIVYRFNTSYLYYPMMMTSMIFDFPPPQEEYYYNSIVINVFTITCGLPKDNHILENGFGRNALFEIEQNDLKEISPEIADMFHGETWLGSYSVRVWLDEAKTSHVFAQDFIVKETYTLPSFDWVVTLIVVCEVGLIVMVSAYLLILIKKIPGLKIMKKL
ncbi:MAG: DUF2330 domain-containing protein [Thermoplasmatales archaeon]|nr:DUF2330 domain-containing protein [Thermoplasmatales archaeon]